MRGHEPKPKQAVQFPNLPEEAEGITVLSDGSLMVATETRAHRWKFERGRYIKEGAVPFPESGQSPCQWFGLYYCVLSDAETKVYDLDESSDTSLAAVPVVTSMGKIEFDRELTTMACVDKSHPQQVVVYKLDKKAEPTLRSEASSPISCISFLPNQMLVLGLVNGNIEVKKISENKIDHVKTIKESLSEEEKEIARILAEPDEDEEETLVGEIAAGDQKLENKSVNSDDRTMITQLFAVGNMFASYKANINLLQMFDTEHFECIAKKTLPIDTNAKPTKFVAAEDGTIMAMAADCPIIYLISFPQLQLFSVRLDGNVDDIACSPTGEAVVLSGNKLQLVDHPAIQEQRLQRQQSAKTILVETTRSVPGVVDIMIGYAGLFHSAPAQQSLQSSSNADLKDKPASIKRLQPRD